MLQFFLWYFTVSLIGWLTFPLTYRLFPALADRGYSLARALGLLVWGYIFWVLASLGVIQNDLGGLELTLLILLILSGAALMQQKPQVGSYFSLSPVREWVKANLRPVICMEVLFFVSFAVWTFVQASNPEITTAGGEKTMELAFINAIMRSPTFPPHDPWLSGYAISYYYFGYVMTAMLAEVTSVTGSVAHNLMLCLIFALSALGAYGVFYDLLVVWSKRQSSQAGPPSRPAHSSLGLSLLGPFFLLIVSNFEGFLEVIHQRGLFWKFNPDGTASSDFWKWLDIIQLNQPPMLPLQWNPQRFIWWWRASRVIQDHTLAGVSIENIDEFPFFSYLLGDLHPHILAMPFDLLAIALALNLFLGGWDGEFKLFRARLHIEPLGFLCSAFVLGGLAFLNTWDVLFGLALLAGVSVLKQASVKGWGWERLTESLALLLPVGLLAILIFLPFYIGFSSQASGILPNLDSPTRGAQLWIFWGVLFLPVAGLLAYLTHDENRSRNWRWGLGRAGGLFLILWLFSWLLAGLILVADPADAQKVLGSLSPGAFFGASTLRRLTPLGGWLSLLALIGVPLAFLVKVGDDRRTQGEQTPPSKLDPLIFMLLLVLIGGLLIVAPEFVFLRDIFTARMNTIFKFYYQAWLLLSLAAAFGVVVLAENLRGAVAVVYRVGLAVMLILACTYPVLAILVKTNDFMLPVFQQTLVAARSTGEPSPLKAALDVWTLDGAVEFNRLFPDDAAAARWLLNAPFGVLVEATKIDASYTDFAQISTYSGLPAVLGWPMHEDQWRGTYAVQGTRLDDIKRLYETNSWQEAQAILKQYDIRYVFIGTLERQTYRVSEDKFKLNLHQVFTQNNVIVYEVPGLEDILK